MYTIYSIHIGMANDGDISDISQTYISHTYKGTYDVTYLDDVITWQYTSSTLCMYRLVLIDNSFPVVLTLVPMHIQAQSYREHAYNTLGQYTVEAQLYRQSLCTVKWWPLLITADHYTIIVTTTDNGWHQLPTRNLHWPLLTTFDYCRPLLTTTDHNCILLTTTYHFRQLLITTDHYWPQLTTTDHYWTLQTTDDHYWALLTLLTTNVHYWPLLTTTDHYWPLLTTADHYWPQL